MNNNKLSATILGIFFVIGLVIFGALIGNTAIKHKLYDRTVTVKGLSEQEYQADIVIWPIRFNIASNDLANLYQTIEQQSEQIRQHLIGHGVDEQDISMSAPSITDKSAQEYGGDRMSQFRYTAFQTVTVYSDDIDAVRPVMATLPELGQKGIVITGDNYMAQTEYLFTRLNEVKPDMIEEATKNAREVAEKFAQDSNSKLGKIRKATQGQFSISARDKNNPHIKKVRVVSTIEYYLTD